MNKNSGIDSKLLEKLAVLENLPTRSTEKAEEGRKVFMRQAQELNGCVTPLTEERHSSWMQKIKSLFGIQRKEHQPMLSTFGTILIIVSLLLGGSGVTVAAAQNSQPDQPLYGVKLLSEETLMDLQTDPEERFDLSLRFTERRAEEIRNIFGDGNTPTDEVQARYQNQIESTIQYALMLPSDQVVPAFEQIQLKLQTQEQLMLQTQTSGSPEALGELARIREMMQLRIQIMETGKGNVQQVQNQLQLQNQANQPDQQNTGQSFGNGSQTSQSGSTGNPWTTGTPTPGSGYGSGNGDNPWTTGTPTPGSGYGSGNGDNPWTTGTPTPGSGYGPGNGTGDCNDCTPIATSQGQPSPAPQGTAENPNNGEPQGTPNSDNCRGGK